MRAGAREATGTLGRNRSCFTQRANDIALDAPIVQALGAAFKRTQGGPAAIEGLSCWTDAALLSAAGVPAICFGPGDIALAHAAEEYVPVHEIERATEVMTSLICDWFRPAA